MTDETKNQDQTPEAPRPETEAAAPEAQAAEAAAPEAQAAEAAAAEAAAPEAQAAEAAAPEAQAAEAAAPEAQAAEAAAPEAQAAEAAEATAADKAKRTRAKKAETAEGADEETEPKAKVKGGAKGGATSEAAAQTKSPVADAAAAQVKRRTVHGPGAEVKAIAKWVRMSPRKARRAIDRIRGKQVDEARLILNFLNLLAAKTVLKVLDSAVANAEHNKGLNRRDLIVKTAFVDGGPVLKRFQPHAQGRAFPIKKRTSHITLVVGK